MAIRRVKNCPALTIIEVVTAISILTLAVIAASAYRYYAILDTRKAEIQITAVRLASLLCESWRGANGSEAFNPVTDSGLGGAIEVASGDPEEGWRLLVHLVHYRIIVDGITYNAVLQWRDITTELRALNVTVGYDWRRSGGLPERSFNLTTYTPR